MVYWKRRHPLGRFPQEFRLPPDDGEIRIADVPFQPTVQCPVCQRKFTIPYASGQMGQVVCCGLLFQTVVARVDLVVRRLGDRVRREGRP